MLKLSQLAQAVGFSQKLIKFSYRDITPRKPYKFINSFQPDQFERLVYEAYPARYHLGVYKKFSWPITSPKRKLIIDAFEALVTGFIGALEETSSRNGRKMTRVGPWARPDKQAEKAAVRFIRRKLRNEGYDVETFEHITCGYDLDAVRGDRHRCVEVKGCKGSQPRFFLTRMERKTAESDPSWELAIVTNALTDRKQAVFYTGAEMNRRFSLTPTGWEALPRK